MQKRTIGQSDLQVTPFCFGGNVFGWTADRDTSFSILDALVAHGHNFIDTADVYARWQPGSTGGDSEKVLGEWFQDRKKRDQVVLATKCGGPMPGGKGLKPEYIRHAVDESLGRLKTDYIDLYYAHQDDPETPMEDVLGAYDGLIKAGKVRWIACSNFTPARLEEALATSARHGLPRYQCLQPQYSLVERETYENGLDSICQREKLGVCGYYSLASGFLTGKYRSEADLGKSVRGQTLKGYVSGEKGQAVLKALDQVAARTGATLAQISLAWLMARPGVTAPIASATSVGQLEELLPAAELRLSEEDMQVLSQA